MLPPAERHGFPKEAKPLLLLQSGEKQQNTAAPVRHSKPSDEIMYFNMFLLFSIS